MEMRRGWLKSASAVYHNLLEHPARLQEYSANAAVRQRREFAW
jgi:hypothetical protein